jgi:hypothetical protein
MVKNMKKMITGYNIVDRMFCMVKGIVRKRNP